jgi:hypothetical protein
MVSKLTEQFKIQEAKARHKKRVEESMKRVHLPGSEEKLWLISSLKLDKAYPYTKKMKVVDGKNVYVAKCPVCGRIMLWNADWNAFLCRKKIKGVYGWKPGCSDYIFELVNRTEASKILHPPEPIKIVKEPVKIAKPEMVDHTPRKRVVETAFMTYAIPSKDYHGKSCYVLRIPSGGSKQFVYKRDALDYIDKNLSRFVKITRPYVKRKTVRKHRKKKKK